MTHQYFISDFDDPEDEDERRTKERRMFMYSTKALAAAVSVEKIHILFPDFKTGLDISDRIYQLGRVLDTPQGAVIFGAPGTCKTTLARYFISALPPSDLFQKGMGAIYIRMRANPSQGQLLSTLLRAMKYPFTEVRASRLGQMRDVVIEALQQKGTKLIFVDQAHCLSNQVRTKHKDVHETAVSDTLREIIEEVHCGMVLLADASFQGLEKIDSALADRITVRHTMAHFGPNAIWNAFLESFAKSIVVVDATILNSTECQSSTHIATDGNRRRFRRLIVEAVLIAVDAAAPILLESHFALAYERTAGEDTLRSNPYAK
jgi:Bacterial TniB protein